MIGIGFPDEWPWVGGLEIDDGMEDAVLSLRRVSLAKKSSTALSHEHEVGVKWKVQRGWRAGHAQVDFGENPWRDWRRGMQDPLLRDEPARFGRLLCEGISS